VDAVVERLTRRRVEWASELGRNGLESAAGSIYMRRGVLSALTWPSQVRGAHCAGPSEVKASARHGATEENRVGATAAPHVSHTRVDGNQSRCTELCAVMIRRVSMHISSPIAGCFLWRTARSMLHRIM
jgi:hypothetical protein